MIILYSRLLKTTLANYTLMRQNIKKHTKKPQFKNILLYAPRNIYKYKLFRYVIVYTYHIFIRFIYSFKQ